MGDYFSLIVGAILVNNFVLSRILGICPFLGVSRNTSTALGMGGAVIFVMALSGFATACVHQFILIPYQVEYLKTIVFILVIAGLVQIVEVLLQRFSETLYKALGIYLPLITTNCAVLGVAQLNIIYDYTFLQAIVFAMSSGLGFTLAMLLMAGIREKLEFGNVPRSFQGAPIAFIMAGLMSLAFLGFSNMTPAK